MREEGRGRPAGLASREMDFPHSKGLLHFLDKLFGMVKLSTVAQCGGTCVRVCYCSGGCGGGSASQLSVRLTVVVGGCSAALSPLGVCGVQGSVPRRG